MAKKEWVDGGTLKEYAIIAAEKYGKEQQVIGKFGGHAGLPLWKARIEGYQSVVVIASKEQPQGKQEFAICIETNEKDGKETSFHKCFTKEQYEKEKSSGGGGGKSFTPQPPYDAFARLIFAGKTPDEAVSLLKDFKQKWG